MSTSGYQAPAQHWFTAEMTVNRDINTDCAAHISLYQQLVTWSAANESRQVTASV